MYLLFAFVCIVSIVLVKCDEEIFHENGHTTRIIHLGHLELKTTTYLMPDEETVASKVVFSMDKESMSEWDTGTCQADEYAEEAIRVIESLGKENAKILMIGLGGGSIGAVLAKDHDVTVLDRDSLIISTAPLFWKNMESCGYDGSKMKIVRGDANNPPDFEHKFDIVFVDTQEVAKGHEYNSLKQMHNIVDDDHSVLVTHTWGIHPIMNHLPYWDYRAHTTTSNGMDTIYVSDWRWVSTDDAMEEEL